MKNKGFTLVELLAVIIVLSIILIIAVPRVLNTIEASKKKSFEISVKSLEKELKSLYIKDNFNISKNGKSYVITNKAFVGEALDVKGEIPDSGNLYIDEEGKTAFIIKKNNLCAVKDFNDDSIFVSNNPELCILNVPEPVPEICFTYTSTVTEVTITGYDNACSKNVIIPDTLGGLPVKYIGSSAFRTKQLTSVVLPEGLKTIGLYSFMSNLLTKIEFPTSITSIGYAAFSSNRITKVIIPNSITTLGDHAFKNNRLVSITMPTTYVNMGMGIFTDNQMPTDKAYIYNKNMDGSDNLTYLNSYAGFDREHADIPSGIVTIGRRAFQGTFLKSFTLPNTVVTIKGGAFQSNDITNVIIPNSVLYIEEVAFNNSFISNLTLSNSIRTIGWSAFKNNYISSVTFPNTLTRIEYEAFSGNRLTDLTIPTTVTHLGGGAFNGNLLPASEAMIYGRNLDGSVNYSILNSYAGVDVDTIAIPATVTVIDDHAFQYSGLKSITIPNIVTSIGSFAFAHNDLSNITISNTASSMGIYAFADNELTSITIPNSVTTMGYAAFMWNTLTSVTIPANIAMNSSLPQISSTFNTAYVTDNGSAGGTYTAPSQDGVWTKQ